MMDADGSSRKGELGLYSKPGRQSGVHKLVSKEGSVFKLVVLFEKQTLTQLTQSGTDWHAQRAGA